MLLAEFWARKLFHLVKVFCLIASVRITEFFDYRKVNMLKTLKGTPNDTSRDTNSDNEFLTK